MSIAILVPTRDRVEQLRRMMISALDGTTDVHIYVYVADNDPAFDSYKYLKFQRNTQLFTGPDYPTVHKWNMLAEQAIEDGHEFLMLGADDMYFNTPGWELALTEVKAPHVYHLQDSRDENGTPHPIVNRAYVEKMGYFLPPIFLHWFCDSWTVEIAKANDCFTHLKEFSLVHDKPSDAGKPDETHSRIRNAGWNERDAYVNNVMLPLLESMKGKLR